MARQQFYPSDSTLNELDRLTGIDSQDNSTKNFTIGDIAEFFAKTGIADPSRLSLHFDFDGGSANQPGQGKINYDATPGVDGPVGVNTIYYNRFDNRGQDSLPLFGLLRGATIKVVDTATEGNVNYAIYLVRNITRNDDFLTLSVQHLGSAGRLSIAETSLTLISGQIEGVSAPQIYRGTDVPQTGQPPGVINGDLFLREYEVTERGVTYTRVDIYGPYADGWGEPTELSGQLGAQGPQGVSITGDTSTNDDDGNTVVTLETTDPATGETGTLPSFTVNRGEDGLSIVDVEETVVRPGPVGSGRRVQYQLIYNRPIPGQEPINSLEFDVTDGVDGADGDTIDSITQTPANPGPGVPSTLRFLDPNGNQLGNDVTLPAGATGRGITSVEIGDADADRFHTITINYDSGDPDVIMNQLRDGADGANGAQGAPGVGFSDTANFDPTTEIITFEKTDGTNTPVQLTGFDDNFVRVTGDQDVAGVKNFTGNSTAVTQATTVNNNTIATTQYVNNVIDLHPTAGNFRAIELAGMSILTGGSTTPLNFVNEGTFTGNGNVQFGLANTGALTANVDGLHPSGIPVSGRGTFASFLTVNADGEITNIEQKDIPNTYVQVSQITRTMRNAGEITLPATVPGTGTTTITFTPGEINEILSAGPGITINDTMTAGTSIFSIRLQAMNSGLNLNGDSLGVDADIISGAAAGATAVQPVMDRGLSQLATYSKTNNVITLTDFTGADTTITEITALAQLPQNGATDQQVIAWDNANSRWAPSDAPGGDRVDIANDVITITRPGRTTNVTHNLITAGQAGVITNTAYLAIDPPGPGNDPDNVGAWILTRQAAADGGHLLWQHTSDGAHITRGAGITGTGDTIAIDLANNSGLMFDSAGNNGRLELSTANQTKLSSIPEDSLPTDAGMYAIGRANDGSDPEWEVINPTAPYELTLTELEDNRGVEININDGEGNGGVYDILATEKILVTYADARPGPPQVDQSVTLTHGPVGETHTSYPAMIANNNTFVTQIHVDATGHVVGVETGEARGGGATPEFRITANPTRVQQGNVAATNPIVISLEAVGELATTATITGVQADLPDGWTAGDPYMENTRINLTLPDDAEPNTGGVPYEIMVIINNPNNDSRVGGDTVGINVVQADVTFNATNTTQNIAGADFPQDSVISITPTAGSTGAITDVDAPDGWTVPNPIPANAQTVTITPPADQTENNNVIVSVTATLNGTETRNMDIRYRFERERENLVYGFSTATSISALTDLVDPTTASATTLAAINGNYPASPSGLYYLYVITDTAITIPANGVMSMGGGASVTFSPVDGGTIAGRNVYRIGDPFIQGSGFNYEFRYNGA